jgi:hypothetical protein
MKYEEGKIMEKLALSQLDATNEGLVNKLTNTVELVVSNINANKANSSGSHFSLATHAHVLNT